MLKSSLSVCRLSIYTQNRHVQHDLIDHSEHKNKFHWTRYHFNNRPLSAAGHIEMCIFGVFGLRGDATQRKVEVEAIE